MLDSVKPTDHNSDPHEEESIKQA